MYSVFEWHISETLDAAVKERSKASLWDNTLFGKFKLSGNLEDNLKLSQYPKQKCILV